MTRISTATDLLPPGTRVRHAGQQYSSARGHGTATVLASFDYGPHVEYLVARDQPLVPGMGLVTAWAQTATVPADDSTPALVKVLLGAVDLRLTWAGRDQQADEIARLIWQSSWMAAVRATAATSAAPPHVPHVHDPDLDNDTNQYGGVNGPFHPWDGDGTALVHVLWYARNCGLDLADDTYRIADMITRSRWLAAVQAEARAGVYAAG